MREMSFAETRLPPRRVADRAAARDRARVRASTDVARPGDACRRRAPCRRRRRRSRPASSRYMFAVASPPIEAVAVAPVRRARRVDRHAADVAPFPRARARRRDGSRADAATARRPAAQRAGCRAAVARANRTTDDPRARASAAVASSAGSFSSAMPGGDTRGRMRPSFGSKFGSVRIVAPPISSSSVA